MKDQITGQEVERTAAADYARQLSQPTYVTEQQEWNRVHAQLLKSVADAQAKLLAALNELPQEVFAQFQRRIEPASASQIASQKSVDALNVKLDEIRALLARPRRQVERLRTKQIVKRATSKEKRHA